MYVQLGIFFASSIITSIGAAPTEIPQNGTSMLERREIDPWHESCSRTNQFKSDKSTYKDKAAKAFADAQTMTDFARDDKNTDKTGALFQGTQAYRNYFGPEDADLQQVLKMLKTLNNNKEPASNDDPEHDGYKFKVWCGSDMSGDCAGGTLAATGPTGNTPNIVLCDQFFRPNTLQTKYDLDSGTFFEDPANPPGRIPRSSWCQSDREFPFFEVAGLTVLHEMTHLDIVGFKAGLEEITDRFDLTGHGTIDIYQDESDERIKKYYDLNNPYKSARTLNHLWEQNKFFPDTQPDKPKWPPVRNAESYAAAIFEFYFMVRCGFDEILPHTVYTQ